MTHVIKKILKYFFVKPIAFRLEYQSKLMEVDRYFLKTTLTKILFNKSSIEHLTST